MRALLPLLLLGCASTASGDSRATTDEAPLVIELFTSQGCSSCPSAEALLNDIARTGKLDGRTVAPLAFHVDYWDELGWPDPYASPAWTERQREYAEALGDRQVYTPELVVGGKLGMVGSQGLRIKGAIAAAARQQKITATARWTAAELVVDATAPAGADVYVALWQDGTRTVVARGENAGSTLSGDRVVRKLVLVAKAGKTGTQTLKLDASWHGLGAIAFAQKPDRSIIGSALLPKH